MRTLEMGGLRVRIAGGTDREGGGNGPALILLHGFGAPGDDLASLWRVLRAPVGTRFIFPEAPLSLASIGFGAGRAWWMIDLERMNRRAEGPALLEWMKEVPDGLAAARERVIAMIDKIETELRPSALALGGFSQGAMLSCDVALRTKKPLAGLVMMSGAMIAEPEWAALMPQRRGLPALMSHGRADAILPFAAAERLRDALTGAGVDVTWIPFNGGHEIPAPAVDGVGNFLERVLRAAP